MFEYAQKIKPILIELDDMCPFNKPVGIEADLLPLFKKHTNFKTIDVYPVVSDIVEGIHFGDSKRGFAAIFPHKCEKHSIVIKTCPDCQLYRLSCAKELVHTLDRKNMKTSPCELEENIVTNILKGSFDANPQVRADGVALPWAIELLIRYRHRIEVAGGWALTRARANDNYSHLADSYGVPSWAVEIAFSESYMSAIKKIREAAELPC